jgi:hypothetical protein
VAERVAPAIFNVGARWKRMVNFTPRPPYTRERKACVISHTLLSQT